MDLGEIDLRAWRSLTDVDRAAVAGEVAARTGASIDRLPRGQAHFDHRGVRYAFVPASGGLHVGYDGAQFQPSPDQEKSHQDTMAAAGWDESIQDVVQLFTSPLRPASVGPMLVAITAIPVPGRPATYDPRLYSALAVWLGDIDAALPTPDEWEFAHGAGGGTLWAWGDSTEPPPQWAGNAFGLEYDPNAYTYELTADEAVFCGGDGGTAECGGWGTFARALPLATAFRSPDPDPLREYAGEQGLVRPVLRLS